tara:strand:- start:387 stop:1646 length:1260 start_codon:yes stop_codon:yes gene_type:complete
MMLVKNDLPSLPIQKWMKRKSTSEVIKALTRTGGEARFVGGCIRDTLAGKAEPQNIDIATPIRPRDVQKLLTDYGLTQIPTGIEHGTITTVVDGEVFEITTLRADLRTDGRHAIVEYTDDWEVDARRRDFTINSIYCDPDGSLFDPMGGVSDLKKNKIRFIGDPEKRISEDLLRILRYFRFKAVFNNIDTDSTALDACKKFAPYLKKISGERIYSELLKLLASPDPIPSLTQCRDCKVIDNLFGWAPSDARLKSLKNLIKYEEECGDPDPIRRLVIFAQDNIELDKLTGRLKLPKTVETRLKRINNTPNLLSTSLKEHDCYKIIYKNGKQFFIDNLLTDSANFPESMPSNWVSLVQDAFAWVRPQCPISGEDVVALGIPEGPLVGQIVMEAETWWIDNNFKTSRQETLDYLMTLTTRCS